MTATVASAAQTLAAANRAYQQAVNQRDTARAAWIAADVAVENTQQAVEAATAALLVVAGV